MIPGLPLPMIGIDTEYDVGHMVDILCAQHSINQDVKKAAMKAFLQYQLNPLNSLFLYSYYTTTDASQFLNGFDDPKNITVPNPVISPLHLDDFFQSLFFYADPNHNHTVQEHSYKQPEVLNQVGRSNGCEFRPSMLNFPILNDDDRRIMVDQLGAIESMVSTERPATKTKSAGTDKVFFDTTATITARTDDTTTIVEPKEVVREVVDLPKLLKEYPLILTISIQSEEDAKRIMKIISTKNKSNHKQAFIHVDKNGKYRIALCGANTQQEARAERKKCISTMGLKVEIESASDLI